MMITYPSTYGVFETRRQGAVRAGAPPRRPGLRRRREHERAGRRRRAGRVRRRRQPPEPAQDLLHPARRRRAGRRPGVRGRGPGALPARRTAAAGIGTAERSVGAVSAAPLGNAAVLPISWMYMRMMGADGPDARDRDRDPRRQLRRRAAGRRTTTSTSAATSPASRAAASRTSASSTCGRSRRRSGVSAEDVAKRLIDYGFHAPTLSFPVAGTLMVEPTESESLRGTRPLLRRDDRDPRRDRARSSPAPGRATTTR